MLLAVDVHYESRVASVAGVSFRSWQDAEPANIFKIKVKTPSDYQPGAFYRRELPCVLTLIESCQLSPETIIIDGFVYLDKSLTPGLGKHLFDELAGRANVIGVAKSHYKGISHDFEIFRGRSTRPLYVTSEGLALEDAKRCVASMHGKYRIPTLLKIADQESRAG